MHNCKSARDSFIDLALDELPPATSQQLMTELNGCRACRDEYAALRSTLHVSNQALRSASPSENFWPGYHDRLRTALLASSATERGTLVAGSKFDQRSRASTGLWPALRAVLTTSVQVPLPAALALMFMFVISVVGLRALGNEGAIPATPIATVETRTVLVPVVQEKVVTRVVYAERKSGRRGESDRTPSNIGNTLASATPASSSKSVLNLVGFKPTDEVKLTIIKGSDPK
jgi:hypothetical protein